jgi:hypothetical protein
VLKSKNTLKVTKFHSVGLILRPKKEKLEENNSNQNIIGKQFHLFLWMASLLEDPMTSSKHLNKIR